MSIQNYCKLVELRIKARCRGLIHVVEEISDENDESVDEDDEPMDEYEKHNKSSNTENRANHPDEFCAEEDKELEKENEESCSSSNFEEDRLRDQQRQHTTGRHTDNKAIFRSFDNINQKCRGLLASYC